MRLPRFSPRSPSLGRDDSLVTNQKLSDPPYSQILDTCATRVCHVRLYKGLMSLALCVGAGAAIASGIAYYLATKGVAHAAQKPTRVKEGSQSVGRQFWAKEAELGARTARG